MAWNSHGELFDRLESGLHDRTRHLSTDEEAETADRRQEREEQAIQLGIINAQRAAVIDLRDSGEIERPDPPLHRPRARPRRAPEGGRMPSGDDS